MKTFFKSVIYIISCIIVLPLILNFKILKYFLNEDGIFSSTGQFLSLIPGKPGNYLRCAFYSQTNNLISKNCCIEFGTYFSHYDVEISDGVYIGAYCIIGKAKIESHCTIGSFVNVLSGKNQHNFNDFEKPIQEQGGEFIKIVIGENSWLGNGAIIMDNIGKHAIVGAGTVVVKQLEGFSVYSGNPAKCIKQLKKN